MNLIIKSIKLENFISHEITNLSFPLGVSVIIGPNGAGKSSILDAIFYALCGTQVRGDNINDLIYKKADRAKVTLNFEQDGIEYAIRRERDRNKSPLAFLKNKEGNSIASGQTEVNREIIKIIGLEKDAIINSVFIRQGEITKLIDGTPGERKTIIAKLLGIDKLDKCYKEMHVIIDEFKKNLNKEGEVKLLLNRETDSKKEIETENDKALNHLKEIENNLKESKKELEQIKSEKKSWDEKRNKNQDLNVEKGTKSEQIISLKQKINEISTKIEDAEKAKTMVTQIKSKIINIDLLEKYIEEFRKKENIDKDLINFNNELNQIELKAKKIFKKIDIKEKEKKEKEIEKKISDIDIEIQSLKFRKGENNANIDAINKYSEILEESNVPKCPVCSHELSIEKKKDIINTYSTKKISINKDIEIIDEETKKLDSEKEKNTKELRVMSSIDLERYQNIKAGIKESQKDLLEINKDITEIAQKLQKIPDDPEKELKAQRDLNQRYILYLEKSSKLTEQIEENQKNQKNLELLQDRMNQIESEIVRNNYKENLYQDIIKKYIQAEKNLGKCQQDELNKKEILKGYNTKLESIKKTIKELQIQIKSFEKYQKFIVKLEKIREAFSKDGLQRSLRHLSTPEITRFARQYLNMFNLNIIDIKIDEDLDISVVGKSGLLSINSISGGEKVAIAIVLRLAIARLISGQMATVIMDEPTTHLDEERRKELIEAMKNFKKESHSIPQLIIVTHHRELEDLADTILEVELKDGISVVKETT